MNVDCLLELDTVCIYIYIFSGYTIDTIIVDISLMWEKQCHKPSMTGNGNHTTYENAGDWGMVCGMVLSTLAPKGQEWLITLLVGLYFFFPGVTVLYRERNASRHGMHLVGALEHVDDFSIQLGIVTIVPSGNLT